MLLATMRPALADLRRHRLQTVLLFIILTVATLTLSLAVMVERITNGPFDRLMAETDGADLWFTAGPGVDLAGIAALDGVTATAGPYGDTRVALVGQDGTPLGEMGLRLLAQPADQPEIGRAHLISGRWLAGADEIVLDPRTASFMNVQPGGQIRVQGPDGPITLTVAGLGVHLVAWGVEGDGVTVQSLGLTLPETLARIAPDRSAWGQSLAVRIGEDEEADAVISRAAQLVPAADLRATSAASLEEVLTADAEPTVIMLGIFSLFALGAAALVIANAIGGRVLAQYREIGLLKAAGFTPAGVIGIFLLSNLIRAAAGIVAGLLLGMLLAPVFEENLSILLTTTPVSPYAPLPLLLVVLIVLGAVALATSIPALAGARVPAVQAISRGPLRAQTGNSRLAALGTRLQLPVSARVGLKDAFARPLRAWATVAALVLTIVTLTFTLGIWATMGDLLEHPEKWGAPYDLLVETDGQSAVGTEAILNGEAAIDSWAARLQIVGRVPGGPAVTAFALQGALDPYRTSIAEGRLFEAPGEAVAGHAFMDAAGLEIGDRFTLEADGNGAELTIVGRVIDVDYDGRIVLFGMETARSVDPSVVPDSYLVRLRPGSNQLAAIGALQAAGGDGLRVTPIDLEAEDDVARIRAVLLGLNAVLIVIGVVNLLSTTMLTVRERFREVGVLKAIGLTPAQVQAGIFVATGALALASVLIGIPLGLLVTRWVFAEMGAQMGVGGGVGVMPGPAVLALLVPVAIGLGLLGALLPARRAAGLSVAAALRYE